MLFVETWTCAGALSCPVSLRFLVVKRCSGICQNKWTQRESKSVFVCPRQKERETITHRDAGQSGSPSTVTFFSLWCKDILELLGPTAAVYHAASSSSLALYVTVAIISTVLPPMACCGLSHEYLSPLFLIHVHIIVLHKDKLYGVGGANVRVEGGTKCPG